MERDYKKLKGEYFIEIRSKQKKSLSTFEFQSNFQTSINDVSYEIFFQLMVTHDVLQGTFGQIIPPIK